MFPELRFREYYGHLADDELARIALTDELVPEAQQALKEELQKRGLTDLSEYKRALEQAAAYRKEEAQQTLYVLKAKVAIIVFVYPTIWLIYHATGWLGIHHEDVRAQITMGLLLAIAGFGNLWLWIRRRRIASSPRTRRRSPSLPYGVGNSD
jgi:hypothetical protein